jgi:hypothetical protein
MRAALQFNISLTTTLLREIPEVLRVEKVKRKTLHLFSSSVYPVFSVVK